MDAPPEPLLQELEEFLETHPETRFMDVLAADINGIVRGKRLPQEYSEKPLEKGANFCAGAPLAKYSSGQFEVNLQHVDDPVLACDHAIGGLAEAMPESMAVFAPNANLTAATRRGFSCRRRPTGAPTTASRAP